MHDTAIIITVSIMLSLLVGVGCVAVWPAYRAWVDARRRRRQQLRRVRRYHA